MDPLIQNWRAELDVGRGRTPSLRVSGDVVSDQPVLATLTVAPEQGTMAQDLFLVLTFELQINEKHGADINTQIHFDTPANQGQYTQVTIYYQERKLHRLDVIEVG